MISIVLRRAACFREGISVCFLLRPSPRAEFTVVDEDGNEVRLPSRSLYGRVDNSGSSIITLRADELDRCLNNATGGAGDEFPRRVRPLVGGEGVAIVAAGDDEFRLLELSLLSFSAGTCGRVGVATLGESEFAGEKSDVLQIGRAHV